jgi:hypothetical protein
MSDVLETVALHNQFFSLGGADLRGGELVFESLPSVNNGAETLGNLTIIYQLLLDQSSRLGTYPQPYTTHSLSHEICNAVCTRTPFIVID